MDAYAELHCHTNFSFLDGASAPDELAERAAELGLVGLGVTDHQGLYGVVRAAAAYEEAGLSAVLGVEVELRDALVPDPDGLVVPARRSARRGGRRRVSSAGGPLSSGVREGEPDRPRPERTRLPGHREAVKEDVRGIGERQRGPHLVLLARDATGYRSLCRLVSRANLVGTKAMPRFEGNRARPFLFSTSHPPSVAATCIAAFEVLEQEPERIEKLWENTRFWKKELGLLGFDIGGKSTPASETPITPIIIGDGKLTMDFSRQLFKEGVMGTGIAFPTVPEGKARIRTIMTATHTREELDQALAILKKVGKQMGILN